ncbi:MAG: hypothetical protein NT010_00995 [Proteobacteria bacterium]|nr:hypothetical protein [Pseudomonadota bacterium]
MILCLRALMVIALCMFFTMQSHAVSQEQIDNARYKGLAWLMTHQLGDGSWQAAPGLEVQSTAAALDALTNAGIRTGYSFGAAVSWLMNADAPSVDSLSRKIIALK